VTLVFKGPPAVGPDRELQELIHVTFSGLL